MISLRLTADLENKLNATAKNENVSKSAIIKRALILYFKESKNKKSPYDLGKDLFGNYGSGKGNLSQDYKKTVKRKLREKYSH